MRYTASSGIEGSNPYRSTFRLQHKGFGVRGRPQLGEHAAPISATEDGSRQRSPFSILSTTSSPSSVFRWA
jgi:hypothetical protein